jgi:hypothetical protein
MTTIAMVAGMLPSAYGVGDGGEFRAPMAIGVIGGLIVSTALSLVFVPSFYSIIDSINVRTSRFLGRFVGPNEDEAPAAHAHEPPRAVAKPELRLAAE